MPFKSKAQMRKCFAMKGRGQAKGWDCEEWAHKTKSVKKLPYKKKEASARGVQMAILAEALEKQAGTLSEVLGIRAAALSLGMGAGR